MKLFPGGFSGNIYRHFCYTEGTFWRQVPSETLLHQIIRMAPSKVHDCNYILLEKSNNI